MGKVFIQNLSLFNQGVKQVNLPIVGKKEFDSNGCIEVEENVADKVATIESWEIVLDKGEASQKVEKGIEEELSSKSVSEIKQILLDVGVEEKEILKNAKRKKELVAFALQKIDESELKGGEEQDEEGSNDEK
jgi:hypothetical protein